MFCRKCGNKIDSDSKFCTGCGEKVIVGTVDISNSTKTNESSVKKYSLSINRKHELFNTYKSLGTVTSLILLHIIYNFFSSLYFLWEVSWLDGLIVLVIYSLIAYYYLRVASITYGNYIDSNEANKVNTIMKVALVLYVLYYLLNFFVTSYTPDVFTTEELDSQYSLLGTGIIAFAIYYYFYSKTRILLTPEAKNLSLETEREKTNKQGTDILRLIAWGIVGFFVLMILVVLLFSL